MIPVDDTPTQPVGRSKRPTVEEAESVLEGERFGRFLVLEHLGEGGMGLVFAAYDTELDRRVAIKLLRTDIASTEAIRAQAVREAKALAKLSHPNVVTVYEVGEVGDRVFLVMELIDGATLGQWLKEPRTPSEIASVLSDAGRGLAAAHAAGLVHRDFKPGNVVIGKDGRTRVVDFGVVSSPDLAMIAVGGTPPYMSPEQHLGEPVTDRADQFAFCVTLFEALCGVRPFAGRDESDVRDAILKGELVDVQKPVRSSRRLLEIAKRGLAIEPRDRFDSMNALVGELSRKPRKRKLQFAVGVAVAALAVVAVLGWTGRDAGNALCDGTDGKLAGVWDASIANRVQSAFSAANPRLGSDTFSIVQTRLDTFATKWRGLHRAACQSSVEDRSRADVLAELACLSRKKEELGALTSFFKSAADKKLVERAAVASSMLSDPARCKLTTQARLGDPDFRGRLLSAEAAHRGGDYTKAEQLTRALLKQNDELEPIDRADSLLLLGRILSTLGSGKEAQATLTEAISIAAEIGADELLANANAELLWVTAYVSGDAEKALAMYPLAAASVKRAPPSAALSARLAFVRASSLIELGRYDEASAELDRSLKIAEVLPTHHPDAVRPLLSVGNVANYTGNSEKAIATFRKVLALREQNLGPKHPRVSGPLINLGGVLSRTGQPEEAIRQCERSLAIDTAALGANHAALADSLRCLASAARAQSRFDDAASYLERALGLAETDSVGGGLYYVLTLYGAVEADRGDYGRAIELCERAASLFPEAESHPDDAEALSCLGRAQLALGKRAAARKQLEGAIAARGEAVGLTQEHGEILFALAQTFKPPTSRATELARAAREHFASSNSARHLVVVDAWLAAK